MFRGKNTWVPEELIKEAKIIKETDKCESMAEAFRRMARDYSPVGREIKQMKPQDFIKKVFRIK